VKKKTKPAKTLSLHRETLAILDSDLLRRIEGGGNTTVSGPLSECGLSACVCDPE
jgi:hypothetical protein